MQHHDRGPGGIGRQRGHEGQAQAAIGIAPGTGVQGPVAGERFQHGLVQGRVAVGRALWRGGHGQLGSAGERDMAFDIDDLDAPEHGVVEEIAVHELAQPQRVLQPAGLAPLQPAFAQVGAALRPGRVVQAFGVPVGDLARTRLRDRLQAAAALHLFAAVALPAGHGEEERKNGAQQGQKQQPLTTRQRGGGAGRERQAALPAQEHVEQDRGDRHEGPALGGVGQGDELGIVQRPGHRLVRQQDPQRRKAGVEQHHAQGGTTGREQTLHAPALRARRFSRGS